MSKIHLIPYQVEEVVEATNEVPYGVTMIEAPEIWEQSDKGKGVVVAVIDTGCQTDHPDLQSRIIDGRNFTTDYSGDSANYSDNNGHGTHVAGTIAAILDNKGVVGVAPEANLLVLKVLSGSGSGNYEWIINAIHHAIEWEGSNGEKVAVISMSLGGPQDVPELHEAIKRALDHEILVVCAAGNEGDDQEDTVERSYPGSYNEVVQVGAVDLHGKIAPFTNTNDEIDLVAPGVNILSTFIEGKYARLSGTSMSTPHIVGAAALLINLSEKEFKRKLTEPEIYAQLIKRTVPLGYQNSAEGNGIISLAFVDKFTEIVRLLIKKTSRLASLEKAKTEA
jgi:major intracellular serine protease